MMDNTVVQPLALPRPQPALIRAGLVAGLLFLCMLSLSQGAAGVGPLRLLQALGGAGLEDRERLVLFDIRLPRLVLTALVGAGLAVAGALLQGLFRNPLADPGIVGVSSGAGLGAVLAIVLGGALPAGIMLWAGPHLVGIAAFLGGWIVTIALYRIATAGGRTEMLLLLLAGLAVAAFTGALTGVLVTLADDNQLRDLSFWAMGSMAGATWGKVMLALPMIGFCLLAAPRAARALNALSLGEAQAFHLGHDVQRVKRAVVLIAALATGAAVAVSGGIGFVGIIVPHLLRQVQGPDHRNLLPNAAILGASLLVLADMIARMVVAPAELPIGIITALIGAPVFLSILLSARRGAGGGL